MPFIQIASSIVDKAVMLARNRNWSLTGFVPDAYDQEIMERWLSAHFYCMMDPMYLSKSTGGASGSYQRKSQGVGFESTEYGMAACNADLSGCLKAIGSRQFANLDWAGVVTVAANEYGISPYSIAPAAVPAAVGQQGRRT